MPFDPDKYLGTKKEGFDPDTYLGKEEPGMAMKALQTAGQVLDYPGGLVRTGLAHAADPFIEGDIATLEDVKAAFKGQAPTSSEFMERAGVPAGPSAGPISARGAGGFAADIATDPLTYLSLGTSAAAKAALRPVSTGLKGAGKKLFKTGVKRIDDVAERFGKRPASDILMERGIGGTNKNIAKKSMAAADELNLTRKQLLSAGDEAGVLVDMREATAPARQAIAQMQKSKRPMLKQIAEKMKPQVDEHSAIGKVSPSELSALKTDLYNLIGDSSFDQLKKTPEGKKLLQKMARGFKESSERSLERVQPGMGKQLRKVNDDLGTLLTTANTMNKEAAKTAGKQLVTEIDPWILSTGGPVGLAMKKSVQLGKSTLFQTRAGQALGASGKIPLVDEAARRSIINLLRDE